MYRGSVWRVILRPDSFCQGATAVGSMMSHGPLPIRLLTHNVRYATTSPFKGEERWEVRRPRLISELRFNTFHYVESFICLQEVLHNQLVDILSRLNEPRETWAYIGVGRNDGHEAGEYSPILYQPAVWVLKSYKTVWLSETPDRPSKSWDAASIRILTIGVFQHRESKKTVVAMNTHLDDQGSESRLKAANLILQQIAVFSEETKGRETLPVFLAGDFNSTPDEEAYKTIISADSPICDLQLLVPENQRYGNLHTFTGFEGDRTQFLRIDFLFINCTQKSIRHSHDPTHTNPADQWLVEGYGVLENRFEDGVYISDHRAVIGDVMLQ